MKRKTILLLVLGGLILAPAFAFARVGVGVGTGKIIVNEALNPGTIYKLPNFNVINTGDEPSNYEAAIEYLQGKPELDPPKEWFSLEPSTFYLEPGENQIVTVNLNLPIKSVPGEYFAFISAFPSDDHATPGETTIGVAAASKLYFTVKPANVFVGIYYRALSLYNNNLPWSKVVLIVIGLAILVALFKRKFNIQVNVGTKKGGRKK